MENKIWLYTIVALTSSLITSFLTSTYLIHFKEKAELAVKNRKTACATIANEIGVHGSWSSPDMTKEGHKGCSISGLNNVFVYIVPGDNEFLDATTQMVKEISFRAVEEYKERIQTKKGIK